MIKKFVLAALVLLGVSGAARAQSFTITIDAGFLRDSTGTTNEPVGGLLQLLASPSGTYSAPTANSFFGGDNVLLASFAMNYTGGTGEVIKTITGLSFSTANYTVTSGESLVLRFYPSLTYLSTQNYFATGPGALTASAMPNTYGQVRSSTTEFPTRDASETPWVVPAAGAAKDITYITTLNGGTYTDGINGTGISSFATFVVSPVPEPSSFAYLGGFVGLLGLRRWTMRRRRGRVAV